jgi:putative addiction module antidote
VYQLKITTVGSSAGLILPKHVLEKLRVGKGDVLCLTETPDGFKITPYQKDFAEAMDAAEEIMRENRDALRALAK